MEDIATRLDLFLRGGAATALVFCALVFLGERRLWPRGLSVPALCLGLGAYLLVSTPNTGLQGSGAEVSLVLFAGAVPVLAVWAAAEIFFDRPVFRPWHGLPAVAIVLGAWVAPLLPFAGLIRGILVVVLYAALLFIALSTATDDLVETRRRFRRSFVALMALTGIGISIVELLKLDANLPSVVYPLHALVFLLLTLLFLSWATQLAPDLWPQRRQHIELPGTQPSAADAAVMKRIEAAMSEGVWRQEGLTIGKLATAVNAPEHRVRRAINKGLGYRNFASFINERRIEAARNMLSDPVRADMPVLSIAYDVGFASIGPFNRAFREITGQSPTEFRQSQAEHHARGRW